MWKIYFTVFSIILPTPQGTVRSRDHVSHQHQRLVEAFRATQVAALSRGHRRIGQPVRCHRAQRHHLPALGRTLPGLQHPRHHLHEHCEEIQLNRLAKNIFCFKKNTLSSLESVAQLAVMCFL